MNPQSMLRSNFKDAIVLLLIAFLFASATAAQQEKPGSRGIVPVFEKSRPVSKAVSGSVSRKKPKSYKRISSRKNSGKVSKVDRPGKSRPKVVQPDIAEIRSRQIGITLWQLTEVRQSRDLEIFVESNSGRRRYLLPKRVSIDTIFDPYDLVRFTVESSRRGYLYIIDQELYTDGSLGPAYLVYPNMRIRGGDNVVSPGRPVELPDLNGNPFYFELRPGDKEGMGTVAEVLTVIITDAPIAGLRISDRPLLIAEYKFDRWRARWSGRAEIFESDDRDFGNYTRSEREAAGGRRTLDRDDPMPQTVFMVEGNRNGGSLVTVPLWYGND